MKWIKASERLPEPNKMLHLKHTGSLALGYWNPMQNGFSVGAETYNIKGCEWLDESICPELAHLEGALLAEQELNNQLKEEIERLKSVIEKLPDALVESLGEPIEGNNYRIYSYENERWITHNEVGSGEPLKQWIKSTIEKLKSK